MPLHTRLMPGTRLRPVILIVAGVAGCGKSTVGALLADRLHWNFTDADSFHSEANVAKMRSGIPLTDEDRAPWLHAVADWIDAEIAAGQSAVLACSALKRSYRDEMLSGRPQVRMVFLQVDKDVLASRLTARPGHFFPRKLMESQLEILQPPQPDERVQTVVAEGQPARTAAKIIGLLWPSGQPDPAVTPLPE
jgi:gluconokinase